MNRALSDSYLEEMIKSAVNSSGPLPPDEKFSLLVSALRELQQYRAAAACPAVWVRYGDANHAPDCTLDNDEAREWAARGLDVVRMVSPINAAPQVTSVPEEATPESIEVLASVRPPHGVAFQLDGYERKLASDIWNACRGAMLTGEGETAAPAVQAEPLSVVALANVLRNAPVTPSDSQGKKRGNSPVIPDGYALVPIEPLSVTDAEHVASVLEMIGSFEPDDIDSDSVDLRFELDGLDTGSDVSITEYATRGAAIIRQLSGNTEQVSHPALRDGWVSVPVEPTAKMLGSVSGRYMTPIECWHNMIAAAPKQEAE